MGDEEDMNETIHKDPATEVDHYARLVEVLRELPAGQVIRWHDESLGPFGYHDEIDVWAEPICHFLNVAWAWTVIDVEVQTPDDVYEPTLIRVPSDAIVVDTQGAFRVVWFPETVSRALEVWVRKHTGRADIRFRSDQTLVTATGIWIEEAEARANRETVIREQRSAIQTTAIEWAGKSHRTYASSPGGVPFFQRSPSDLSNPGNFEPRSWERIRQNPNWLARTTKRHNAESRLGADLPPPVYEMDSVMSSDALLMSVLCHPDNEAIVEALGGSGAPEFGVGGAVPKVEDGRMVGDRTELDLVFRGDRGSISLIAEAKLTEHDFTSKPLADVMAYADLEEVFDLNLLASDGVVAQYQLVRNVLAARYHGASFVLLYDARRPDLAADYNDAMGAITNPKLRSRCRKITWQQIASIAPPALLDYLGSKYGIEPG